MLTFCQETFEIIFCVIKDNPIIEIVDNINKSLFWNYGGGAGSVSNCCCFGNGFLIKIVSYVQTS